MTAKEVLDLAKKNRAVMVDLKFVDFPGTWQHFTIPIEELTDTVFTEGSGFDGSSRVSPSFNRVGGFRRVPAGAAAD